MELKFRLQRVLQILEDSERNGTLTDIERDIVLTDLREAYAEVKFSQTENGKLKTENEDDAAKESVEESATELPVSPIILAEEEQETEIEPEVEVELIFNDEEYSSEELVESSEELVSVAETPNTFNIPNASTPKRSPLLSLYENEQAPVLGEQFHEAPSVADAISCPKGVAESAPVTSLREAIGVADKFMLIRELFDGDGDAYDVAIDNLEKLPSFDDCVIYIAENYAWRAQSEGTKFMMELLQRKYNA
jgi:hypothetical protein